MMKALKAGLFGLAMGALGAVTFPAHEATAQVIIPAEPFNCCSYCNPNYQHCLTNAGNNSSAISRCVQTRNNCESICYRTC
ncbi:hypothetical protein [Cystobacter ferrugineus]|uniref:Uncharacterized protein n=1 Tax=Cystobacter ferrugineus TaxID=83449 RepID=A0A1L9AXF5_9BACT|nr:hypothetical protein [Cystobacter ferrugineus]OJH34603.1 hypothetical protein BON30_43200 [Cystobacter ferrugineus]